LVFLCFFLFFFKLEHYGTPLPPPLCLRALPGLFPFLSSLMIFSFVGILLYFSFGPYYTLVGILVYKTLICLVY
jgi:hypothetical protein